MRTILFGIALTIMIAPGVSADENDFKDALDAFDKAFNGSWVTETVLDSDVPGVGKKGDKLVPEISFTKQDGLVLVNWKGEVNGKPAGSTAMGLIGWDASRNRLRMRWFATSGSSGTAVYTQRGDRWTIIGQSIDPEGIKGSSRSEIVIEDNNTHVRSITERKLGEESLPDRKETLKRKK